jgi:hypothetical protein
VAPCPAAAGSVIVKSILSPIPYSASLRCGSAVSDGDLAVGIANIYKGVARRVAVKIAERAKDFSSKFPTISVSKDT